MGRGWLFKSTYNNQNRDKQGNSRSYASFKEAFAIKFTSKNRTIAEWNELPPEDERIMDKIWGDAFLSQDIPQGRIRFSPKHIKESVTEKIGKVEIPVYPLGGIVAHEEFHIWQFINIPLQVQRDLKVMNRRDEVEEAWNCTNTEVQAGEFERYWIENWMNH